MSVIFPAEVVEEGMFQEGLTPSEVSVRAHSI